MLGPKDAIQFTDLSLALEELSYATFSASLENNDITLLEGVIAPETLQKLIQQNKEQNKAHNDRIYEIVSKSSATIKTKDGDKKTFTGGSRQEFEQARDRLRLDEKNVTFAFHRLFRTWAICKLINMSHGLLYSTSGQSCRPSIDLLRHRFDLGWHEFELPITDKSGLYPRLVTSLNGMSCDPIQDFHFIDPDIGAISIDHAQGMIEKIIPYEPEKFRKQIQFAEKFVDWSVCFTGLSKDGQINSNSQMLELLEVNFARDCKSTPKFNSSLAVNNALFKLREHIRETGNDRISKAEAKQDFGSNISERSFLTKVWAPLTKEYPNLSKSGRKPAK